MLALTFTAAIRCAIKINVCTNLFFWLRSAWLGRRRRKLQQSCRNATKLFLYLKMCGKGKFMRNNIGCVSLNHLHVLILRRNLVVATGVYLRARIHICYVHNLWKQMRQQQQCSIYIQQINETPIRLFFWILN